MYIYIYIFILYIYCIYIFIIPYCTTAPVVSSLMQAISRMVHTGGPYHTGV